MSIVQFIQFGVGAIAFIGMIVSFLMLASHTPSERVGPADYDYPAFKWFIGFVLVFTINVAIALLWGADVLLRPLIVALYLIVLCSAVLTMDGARSWLSAKFRKVDQPESLAPVKKPWLSKTMVFNAVVAAGLLAEANISGLQGILPPQKYQIVAFLLPIVNMLLRAYTSQGLSLKSATPPTAEAQ